MVIAKNVCRSRWAPPFPYPEPPESGLRDEYKMPGAAILVIFSSLRPTCFCKWRAWLSGEEASFSKENGNIQISFFFFSLPVADSAKVQLPSQP